MIYYGLHWDLREYQSIKKVYKVKLTVKFNYVIVSSTEGYQIRYYFSQLNRLFSVSCRFIMSRMYFRKTSREQD